MGKVLAPHGGIWIVRGMPEEGAQHEGDVARTGVLRLLGKSRAVGKEGVLGAEFPRTGIHLGDEGLLAPRKPLGEGDAGVICGAHRDRLDEFARRIA